MNVQLKDITMTARDGRLTQLDQVYIRGSHIRFFIVPDMLKNAPMFKQQGAASMKGKGIGLGRGKATVARAQGKSWFCCHFASKSHAVALTFVIAPMCHLFSLPFANRSMVCYCDNNSSRRRKRRIRRSWTWRRQGRTRRPWPWQGLGSPATIAH